MDKFNTKDMSNGPIWSKAIVYTIPIILAGLLQMLFNAADLIVVGRYCGSNCIAAVGATTCLIHLILNLFIGLSLGAGVLVAQGLGAKNERLVSQAIHTAIPIAIICGVFLTAVGVLFSHKFLEWMKTPQDIIELSNTYMVIYFCGIISMLLYNFGSAIMRAAGDTKSPLIYLVIAGLINIVLNIIFVTQFGMDVDGVALATTISQTVSAALVVIKLMRRKDECKFEIKKMRLYKEPIKRIIAVGLPSGLQSAMFSIANVLLQSSVNSLGTVATSGAAAAQNIENFIFIGMNSFHQTALNFTGQNVGARKMDRVNKIVKVCLILVTATGLVLGWASILFDKQLLSIYITDSKEALIFGSQHLFIVASLYFLCGIMDVLTGTMRGMGSSVVPMLISVIGVCVSRIIWIYTVFPQKRFHNITWLYASYPISWALSATALFVAFVITRKKLQFSEKIS